MTDTLIYGSPVKSEEKFLTFINESLYGYVEFDLEGYVTFANKSAEVITGYTVEDNVNFKDVIVEEDLERAISDFRLAMTEPNAGPREYQFKRNDGIIVDVEANTLPIKNKEETIGFQTIILDISDRKKIERELIKSEERYRSILQNMEDEYFEFDLEGNVTFYNRSSLNKSGLTNDELARLNFRDSMTPEEAVRVSREFKKIYETGLPAKIEMEVYYKDKIDGNLEKRFIESSAQLIKDEQGRKVGFRSILRDITDRKMYEKKIQENELKYTKLFDSLEEGIIVVGPEGKIEEANPAALKILGYKKTELIGQKTEIIYSDINRRKEVFEILLEHNHIKDYEMFLKKKDGTLIHSKCSATLHRDEDGNILKVDGIFSDITENKKIEKGLRESEANYRTLIQESKDLIVRIDREGIIRFINKSFLENTGYAEIEMLNKRFLEFIHPEDLQFVKDQFADVLSGKTVENAEFRQKTTTGAYINVSVNAVPLYGSDEKVVEISGFGRNITELKYARDNLKESESKYRNLVKGLMDGIVIVQEGKIVFANESIEKIFGYNNGEIIGRSMTDFISAGDREMIVTRGEARDRGEVVPERYSFEAVRKDGAKFEAELSVSSIMYQGKIARQGIVRDITQQKLFEKALIKSEKKYRRIFENMKEGMIVTDHEGRIDTVNPAALEIFGYNSPEDMIGKYAADGYADPGQRKVVFRNLFERGYVKDVEMSFKKSDGTLADIIGSATLHRDKAGNILRTEVIFSDITERKKIEDKLKRSEYKYRTLVESINDLIFSVDLEGRFMFINNAFEKIFDYPLDVMKKAYGFAYVHPDDLELVKEKYRTVLEGGSVENVEFRQKREPTRESYIHLSVNATPLYDEQNNIIGVTGIGRDITELQRVKQDLKEIKSISGAYLEATTDLAVLIDTNGTILDANQEFGKRFSQGIKNLKGKNVYTLFPEEIAGKRKKMGKKVIESRKPLRIQDQRDGKWNDATIYPLLDETGNVSHMAIFTHDITELKENEKKLRDSEKELERKILKRTAELEEVNTALRVLIKNRDADVKEMEGRIIFNINELIMPSLERLKNDNLNERQKTLIGIMEDNLVNITSQFAQGKEAAYLKFTPAEMMVANLVKQGKTNKEIAELYHLSTRTIESHRDSIRKKIGLKNRKVNLRSYLMTGN